MNYVLRLIGMVFVIFFANASFGQASGEVRSNYVNGFIPSCVESQKAMPVNKGVPLKTINSYCKCSAETSANSFSNKQIAMLDALDEKSLSNNALFNGVIKKATDYCMVNFNKF
ncbi:MAG: hypothetical protein WCK52_06770 [Betaproteobacteria bacterium]